MTQNEEEPYRRCIGQQLEELELLTSIYCAPGELQMLDASVVVDFNEFLADDQDKPASNLRSHLEYIIKLSLSCKRSVEVRVALPFLYPMLEQARVSVHSPLVGKSREERLKIELEKYQKEIRDQEPEPYIFQLLTWLQEKLEDLLKRPDTDFVEPPAALEQSQAPSRNIERLWIVSHHIISTVKRQEMISLSRELNLTGFCRPGKPGYICVEGDPEKVQEFWRLVKAMRWQKINVVHTELRQRKRGFGDFSEQLFNEERGVMDMGQFVRFLEARGFGYIKSELFGLP